MSTYSYIDYHLHEASETRSLPKKLREISGIVALENGLLAAIQDEKGNVYVIDFDEGEVEDKVDFGEKGDYEGLALRKGEYWVVRSDGALFQVLEDGGSKAHDTGLPDGVDVEGLAWDAEKDLLVLACKENGAGAEQGKRLCLAYDPIAGKLLEKPYLEIDLGEVADFAALKFPEADPFMPSGAAFHPITQDLYLISSVAKQLAVYSPEGKLQYLESLDHPHFPQPEGICFAANGDLYICSEGDGGDGTIMRFAMP